MSSSEQADDMAEFYEVGQSAQSGHKPGWYGVIVFASVVSKDGV